MVQLTPEVIALGITYYVVLLFSLSVHESAHGWMAWRMGDDTAVSQGRVSLNPVVHIDPVGTILMPLLQFVFTGVPLLAWAKPTPVGAHNFRKLARGHVLVAGAGPVSNGILAVVLTVLLCAALRLAPTPGERSPLLMVLLVGIQMNVALGIFNLIPVPPLDGSWIVSWGLPRPIADRYDRFVEPNGQWLLILFLAVNFRLGILGWLIDPVFDLLTGLARLGAR